MLYRDYEIRGDCLSYFFAGSSFTLLFQDKNAGLGFEDPQTGTLMQATPRDDALYLNVGDISERLSNDEFRN